jgi:hypothetical protein
MPKNPRNEDDPETGDDDTRVLVPAGSLLPKPEPEKPKTVVAVDFQAFLNAKDAESSPKGVDAVVVVPEFVVDEDGRARLAEDQSDAITVRVVPFLGAAALDAIASSDSLSGARILEGLIHPADVPMWRSRIRDAARPIPVEWIAAATKGLLRAHGIGSDVEPGKGSSPPNG